MTQTKAQGMTHVIGGGLAGLTAAIELAKNGQQVRLHEQHRELGGRAATQTQDGALLNLGPHALYLDGAARQTLLKWGITPQGGIPNLGDPSARAAMVYERVPHPFVGGAAGLARAKFLSIRQRIDAGLALGKVMKGELPAPEMTTAQWLQRNVATEPARMLMAALFRLSTYSNEPERQSVRAVMQQLRMGASGVMYVDGGWQSLISSLEQLARAEGVEITEASPIRGDEFRRMLDRREPVILAMPPEQASTLAAEVSSRPFPAVAPICAACLDLVLDEFPENAYSFGLGIDKPLYLSVHSQWAKFTGPGSSPGTAVVHVAKYLGGGPLNARDVRIELENFASLLLPGWRDRLRYARFLPQMHVAHMPVTAGAEPDVDALGIDGVLIAGDWVGSGALLADAAVASGLRGGTERSCLGIWKRISAQVAPGLQARRTKRGLDIRASFAGWAQRLNWGAGVDPAGSVQLPTPRVQ